MPVFNDGITATQAPDPGGVVTTDVLIVGSGPAGSSAALFLSTHGIDNIMITKYRWTANTPRAHITNQRTMEILRDVGIEEQVLAEATPHELMGDTVYCESLAGEEIGRRPTWGLRPDRRADYELASPALPCDIPQTLLEPIMLENATKRGTQTQFSTEYLSHTQDEGASASGCGTDSADMSTPSGRSTSSAQMVPAPGSPRRSGSPSRGRWTSVDQ